MIFPSTFRKEDSIKDLIKEDSKCMIKGDEMREVLYMVQITKDMTISEALRVDRGTAPIFMQFGMHCLGCPSASGESIVDASAVHGIDTDALIEALNNYLLTK